MNPKIEDMRWFALALLALAGVLGQELSNSWPALGLAIASFVLIIVSWVISRMWFFAPIRVTKADVTIDTLPIRRTHGEQAVELRVSMDFLLLYGAGGVKNEVELLWPADVENELSHLISTSKFRRTVQFNDTEGQLAVELHLGIPKTLVGTRLLSIKGEVTEELIRRIDELSERIESGNFQLLWKTSLGEPRIYKARKH